MTQASEMSMSVSCSGCGVQYAGKRGLAGLVAGPAAWRRAGTCGCWRRSRGSTGPPGGLLASGESGELSLADFLRARGFSAYFTTHFAAPLVAAVWSCPPDVALRLPGRLPVRLPRQPRDAVGFRLAAVAHGERRFAVLRRAHRGRPGEDPACRLRSFPSAVTPTGSRCATRPGAARDFDAVVIATHPDQALRLLDPPTRDGAVSARRVPLHARTRQCCTLTLALLPARAGVRASWNYSLGCWRRAGRGAAADQLLHEPAAGPADGAGLHRHAGRAGGRGPGAASSPRWTTPIPLTRGSRSPRSRGCPG